MSCEKESSHGESDSLEMKAAIRPFDKSATAWLLSQAVRYLNTAGEEGEFGYTRVVEVLRHCRDDLSATVNGILQQVKGGDTTLRWNLFYLLGDAGDEGAAEVLLGAALRSLPEKQD